MRKVAQKLADQERGEIEVIKGFLPQQMSDAEAKARSPP
jgi:uncharacterized protein YqeY